MADTARTNPLHQTPVVAVMGRPVLHVMVAGAVNRTAVLATGTSLFVDVAKDLAGAGHEDRHSAAIG